MTKDEIKKSLKDSAFWICPEDNELVSINIDRTADKILKNFLQPVVSGNNRLQLPKIKKKAVVAVLPAWDDSLNKKIEPIVEELREYLVNNPEERKVALWTMAQKFYKVLKEAGKTDRTSDACQGGEKRNRLPTSTKLIKMKQKIKYKSALQQAFVKCCSFWREVFTIKKYTNENQWKRN